MTRTLVTSDIHGCIREFNELLEIANYNPDKDKLILLGDYVDRGHFSKKVVEQVIGMVNNGAVAIRGNHDQMLLDALGNIDDDTFVYNGGMSTIESYTGVDCIDWEVYESGKEYIRKKYHEHVKFLRSLPYFHEDESHIYVHAGIHPVYTDLDWKTQPEEDFIWLRGIFLNNQTNLSKTVIHGHTPTINFQEKGDIIFSNDKINIDGGGVFGGQFNLLEINNGCYIEHSVDGKRYL